MKRIVFILNFIFFSNISYALELNNHEVNFQPIKTFFMANHNQETTLLIKTKSPLNQKEKNQLIDSGFSHIQYAGDLCYYLYSDRSINIKLFPKEIKYFSYINPEYRLSNELQQDLSDYKNQQFILNSIFLKQMDKNSIKNYLKKHKLDIKIKHIDSQMRSAQLLIKASQIDILKKLPIIQYIQLLSKYPKSESIIKSNINLNLNDSNNSIKIGIIDGGKIKTSHIAFKNSKIIQYISNDKISPHATFIAGLLEDNTTLYNYSTENFVFSTILKEMIKKNIYLSNHSYTYKSETKLGQYDFEASSEDKIIYANPYIKVFMAAGNIKNEKKYFKNIKGPANAKNIITISALKSNPNLILKSSRRGPTKDGRIKPDLCINGEKVLSVDASDNISYTKASGTSVATALATKVAAQISNRYKKITKKEIRADILKSVLINTAIDIWTQGPDFFSGFGRIDGKSALATIETISGNAPLIYSGDITHHKQTKIDFNLNNNQYIKITLSWIDPAGNPAANKVLVNDIDMWIVDQNGKKYYPYTLSKDVNQIAKQNQLNHVDNIEQIEINNLPKGKYSLYINGKLIITNSQKFTLTSNLPIF